MPRVFRPDANVLALGDDAERQMRLARNAEKKAAKEQTRIRQEQEALAAEAARAEAARVEALRVEQEQKAAGEDVEAMAATAAEADAAKVAAAAVQMVTAAEAESFEEGQEEEELVALHATLVKKEPSEEVAEAEGEAAETEEDEAEKVEADEEGKEQQGDLERGGEAAAAAAAKDNETVAAQEPTADAAQMVLYSTTLYNGKRPVLHIYDAVNDPDSLSSKKVKRCAFVENVPASLVGVELKGPNAAVCALRAAIDPSKKSLGNNGINKNVALCVNAEGPVQLLKKLIEQKKLRGHLRK